MSKKQALLGMLIVSLFGSSLTVTAAYVLQYISLIGYNSQLIPVFSGLIAGALLFTILGSIMGKWLKHSTPVSIIPVAVLYATIYLLILRENYVAPNVQLTVLAILVSAGFMPVAGFVSESMFSRKGTGFRALLALASAVISILIILAISILYEASGQTVMVQELLTLGSLSIIFLLVQLASTFHASAATEA